MVKRSRVNCNGGVNDRSNGGNSNGDGNRRRHGVALTVGAFVLWCTVLPLLCGAGGVGGTVVPGASSSSSLSAVGEDRSRAAAGRWYADDTAAAAVAARNGRSAANLSHITGTARKIKMFVKNRYLQVFADGAVNSSAEDTSDYVILQRTSVNMGQLKIQGVATCMYLCMDACGLLYGSKDFDDECVFNEMIEQHHYNTYSSAKYTDGRRTLYLALNKRGLPRKVQVKANAPLGKLSTYTQVLTQPVPADRVDRLLASRPPVPGEWPTHGHRHHHACPPHAVPAVTSKHRKSSAGGRKCRTAKGGGRKKPRQHQEQPAASKEDEDCGGDGTNKKSAAGNRCGDEISHRKTDAAGRKKKWKKTAAAAAAAAAASAASARKMEKGRTTAGDRGPNRTGYHGYHGCRQSGGGATADGRRRRPCGRRRRRRRRRRGRRRRGCGRRYRHGRHFRHCCCCCCCCCRRRRVPSRFQRQ